jgi:hypothetical protein
VLLLVIIALKRRKAPMPRLVRFLNYTLLLFLVIDLVSLTTKILKQPKPGIPEGLTICSTCAHPDIYLIIADEYAGKKELEDYFHYDNSSFYTALQQRGFHVVEQPSSNYNFTPFSVASTLNFSYLPLTDPNHTISQVPMIMQLVKQNKLTSFLSASGYRIINNSYFDLEHDPTQTEATFLPTKTIYITSQTLLSRLKKDVGFNLVTRFKLDWAIVTMHFSTVIITGCSMIKRYAVLVPARDRNFPTPT